MKGRFDAGLRSMRQRLSRVRFLPDVNAQRRKQYALAERIASASFDWGYSPDRWQLAFNSALKVIQQFDQEFEEAR